MRRGAAVGATLAVLVSLLLPALAAAETFTVNSTGDGGQAAAGPVCETTMPGECTLRAAIQAANELSGKDEIVFSGTVFKGDSASTITLTGLLPSISSPLRLKGGSCAGGVPCARVDASALSGFAAFDVTADETLIEDLAIDGGSVGIRLRGSASVGSELIGNTISGAVNGIETAGAMLGPGNLIEGNKIDASGFFTVGMAITNGPNRIFGNEIDGAGNSAIFLSRQADGNRIGGDTAASENVIDGSEYGAISMTLPEGSLNEVGRNRGMDNGFFIGLFKERSEEPKGPNEGIQPPPIIAAFSTSVSGTAEPGATVRVFRKATEDSGEIEGFLGEATADAGGGWQASFAAVPVGTLITATQTLNGGTSELTGTVATSPNPTLKIEESGTGSGTIISAPAGIECGGECEASFAPGTEVVLTAVSAPGSTPVLFSGCDSVNPANQCKVTLTEARTVFASFTANPPAPTCATDPGLCPPGPSPVPATSPPPATSPAPTPLKCKKGTRKKKVKGRVECVKVKKHKQHRKGQAPARVSAQPAP